MTISPQGLTVPFVVPVLLLVEIEDKIEDNPETQEETQEMQNITELFNDVDLEDTELLLDDNITHEALQEDEI